MISYEQIKTNYERRGFNLKIFPSSKEANDFVLNLIPKHASIGFGGSESVKQSGLLACLNNGDYVLYHRELLHDMPREEIYPKMFSSDWYICSSNALTENGELINIDGRGNRLASVLDGPKNVIFYCGINKIVSNIEDAIERVRNVATPKNCVRLGKKTPCAVTGKCEKCNSKDSICNATLILHHPTMGTNMYIILVKESLGY